MARKLNTISLQGKDYALVEARVREFWSDNPKGEIDTNPTFLEGDKVMFKTKVSKDKSDPNSRSATGHSVAVIKPGDPKAFEKLETISVGRALANLGYSKDGSIASSEEMEEFLSDKAGKKMAKLQEIMSQVDAIEDTAELREFYIKNKGFGIESDAYIVAKGHSLKKKERGE